MAALVGNPYFVHTAEWKSSGRTGTVFSASGPREYTGVFKVTTRDKRMGPVDACLCPGLPQPWAFYVGPDGLEYDLYALLVEMKPKLMNEDEDSWNIWHVECRWSTELPAGGVPDLYGSPVGGVGGPQGSGHGSANNPELAPPDLEYDPEVITIHPQKDLDGKAYVNSADVPFSPPYQCETGRAVLVMSRNELTFNMRTAARYAFAVNKAKFLDAPPGAAQCMPIKGKFSYHGGLPYWRVTYRIRFREPDDEGWSQTWQPDILDAGTMYRVNDPASPNHKKLMPIMRGTVPVSQPVLLDGNGQEGLPQAVGQPDGSFKDVVSPIYIRRRQYREQDFNKLFTRGMS